MFGIIVLFIIAILAVTIPHRKSFTKATRSGFGTVWEKCSELWNGKKKPAHPPHGTTGAAAEEHHHPTLFQQWVFYAAIMACIVFSFSFLVNGCNESCVNAKKAEYKEALDYTARRAEIRASVQQVVVQEPKVIDLMPNVESEQVTVKNENDFHSYIGDAVVDVRVVWPDGHYQMFPNLSEDNRLPITIVKGMKFSWKSRKRVQVILLRY